MSRFVFILFSVIVFIGSSTAARCADSQNAEKSLSCFQFSLWGKPSVQLYGAAYDVYGLRINLGYGLNSSLYGIDLGMAGKAKEKYGLSLNVIYNATENDMVGILNFGGLVNITQMGDMAGLLNFGGLYNVVNQGDMVGLVNFGGLYNVVADGDMVGLVNLAGGMLFVNSGSRMFGLLNISGVLSGSVGSFYGINISGVAHSMCKGNLYGINISPVKRVYGDIVGVNVSGYCQAAKGSISGINIALFNEVDDGTIRGANMVINVVSNGNIHGLNLFYNMTQKGDIVGVNLGCNYARQGAIVGFNAGVLNISTHAKIVGINLSALGNYAASGELSGVSVGAMNYAGGFQRGVLIGVVNVAEKVSGVQVGVFNYCRKMKGLQIGLINIITEGSIPVMPLFNFSASL